MTEFETIDLGTLGGTSSFALAINEAGMVMGRSALSTRSGGKSGNPVEIFVWTEASGIQRVGPGQPEDLGENGWIIGFETTSRPGYWEQSGSAWTFTPLPFPAGINSGNARGVRPDGGVIVGHGGGLGLIWRRDGAGWTPAILPAPPGGSCEAYRINVEDLIAGHCKGRGIVWKMVSGQWTTSPLDPLPGDVYSFPMRMNETGNVVGWSEDATGFVRAVLWRRAAAGWDPPLFLGTFGGYSQALGINRQGQVVGHSETGGDTRAFLWDAEGLVDFAGPGGGAGSSYDINDRKWIVGVQGSRATLWRPPTILRNELDLQTSSVGVDDE